MKTLLTLLTALALSAPVLAETASSLDLPSEYRRADPQRGETFNSD